MAVTNAIVPERRLTPSVEFLRRQPQAAELVVHALAQLPDHVTLELPPELPQRPTVELLARAYGINSRLSFRPAPGREPLIERLADGTTTFAEVVEELSGDAPMTRLPRGDDAVFKGHRIA